MAANRPTVTLCMVMTMDGHVASPNNQTPSFSSREDRDHLFKLKAASDLLITGAGTVRKEGLQPLIRSDKWKQWRIENGFQSQHPDVLIVSRSGRLPLTSRYFGCHQTFHIASYTKNNQALPHHIHWHTFKKSQTLKDVLHAFHQRGYRQMLLEGGPVLAHSFLELNLIDEIYLTLSGITFGGRRKPGIARGSFFQKAKRFAVNSVQHTDSDVFIHYVNSER
ncbi:MAG: hypothetical protein CR997_09170 [Acidobacteria bacterium]|nr:MAG: hypothetical protein CR997_09170 [Acidobacteriota bacterium]